MSRDPLYDMLKELSKEKKAKRIERNLSKLDDFKKELETRGIQFEEKPHCLMFREPGKPKVDYYQHKGNWRINDKKYEGNFKMVYGGPDKFLNWYDKPKKQPKCDHVVAAVGLDLVKESGLVEATDAFNEKIKHFNETKKAVPHPGFIELFNHCTVCGSKVRG
jgi:hypothetical protein